MKLSVAAIQMESRNDDFEGNRRKAEKYILEAIKKGARLITLPEFALAGYIYTDSIWNVGEPLRGPTHKWLQALCNKYSVYICTCILEKDKEDFFDTFLLCGPGNALWVHRKVEPAAYEAFFFKGAGPNTNVFDTPIGKIGIIICFDSSKTYSIESMKRNRPDVLLLQYSYPEMPSFLSKRDRNNWIETYKNAPIAYAKDLHIPVVATNKMGVFATPIPLGFGLKYRAKFVDQTAIVDGDGEVVTAISQGLGVICKEIEIGTKRDQINQMVPPGRWYLPYSKNLRFTTDFAQKVGMLRYAYSAKRKSAAVR
jgi:predicted amidohydrolase